VPHKGKQQRRLLLVFSIRGMLRGLNFYQFYQILRDVVFLAQDLFKRRAGVRTERINVLSQGRGRVRDLPERLRMTT
jgi:hypothetical protein